MEENKLVIKKYEIDIVHSSLDIVKPYGGERIIEFYVPDLNMYINKHTVHISSSERFDCV